MVCKCPPQLGEHSHACCLSPTEESNIFDVSNSMLATQHIAISCPPLCRRTNCLTKRMQNMVGQSTMMFCKTQMHIFLLELWGQASFTAPARLAPGNWLMPHKDFLMVFTASFMPSLWTTLLANISSKTQASASHSSSGLSFFSWLLSWSFNLNSFRN